MSLLRLYASCSVAALVMMLLLGGCNTRGIEPDTGERQDFPSPLLDTPHRTALIDPIIEAGVQSIQRREPYPAERTPMSPQLLDTYVAERQALMGTLTLPQEYWEQYRQNYRLFHDEVMSRQERTLAVYRDRFRLYLRGTPSPVLEQWRHPVDTAARAQVAAIDSLMDQTYRDASEKAGRDAIEGHVKRMSQLDQRFNVCVHFSLCARD